MKYKTFIIFFGVIVLVSCSNTKSPEISASVPLALETPIKPTLVLPTLVMPKAVSSVTRVEISPFDDPASPLSKKSIFFDFDTYSISSNDLPIITAHGKYILDHKSAKIRLEGNTDERGGREYNLSLGQKRSDSIKTSLVLIGVPESQIESISFGKERSIDQSHNEQAWAKNRRVDIKYLSR